MKERVTPLYIGYHQALELPQNLFPFPRTGHLKICLGRTQFLYSKFHGLLKAHISYQSVQWRLTAVREVISKKILNPNPIQTKPTLNT